MTEGRIVHTDLLQAHPLLRTESLCEARAVVGRAFCDHRLNLRHRDARLAVRHNHVSGRNISLNALRYGAEVEIDPGQLGGFYLLQIPLQGHAFVTHRGEEVSASRKIATILNPDRGTRMVWSGNCDKLLLQIDRTYLEGVAEDLLAGPLPGPVRFAPAVDLDRPQGRALRSCVLTAARRAERGELWCAGAGLQESWTERELAVGLLGLHESNISHALWRSERPLLSRDLHRAIDYMHAHYPDPLRLDEIAAHSGVTPRALQLGFRKAFNLSPMQYLQKVRLDAAHYRLRRRQGRERVTDVAVSCGFPHLGRFAQHYRARFGRSPSEGNGGPERNLRGS
ncbi:AraC family transcriptional regulator [Sediminimonas sp.]|uniref:AraC family transcriptional regulator n=1 Tax=Sediminimonas sp. TaxID=2823379 RepID=UPI0025F89193|nr:AraC family transcriptional regulator [Sediminimonas sp.]